ncbi:FAD/FMN-containing dehydrogenase [Thermosporothrix hazakensis]|uniref:FAD/FMN-containing dehydrogenase n=1 Tax=Thermosporothrix hazakensis TaxID=644383 RepID=A0A326UA21_THEHA|nr:FAD-binding and (Fe-S)-binding domain-containing protein [Thermosporothrix hazakensis]PZW31213.1 FAD/FMN-containing dehydrogenase [Thermosporothrix hazakensis]GCE50878.1 dimethylmenaquinone methyltransferase [Thermosporothrix hazakensis]
MKRVAVLNRKAALGPQVTDGAALERDLRARVRGEVRFDRGSRALYTTDASNYRQVPIGVVLPRDADDVVATVELCRRYGAPVLARGGGTSLAGQCCNTAVIIDMSKYMNNLLELDVERRRARVQPGLILDDLRSAAERYHLTFGPDPATHNHCTLGGMIGNNSCGVHALMAGKTADNVEELEILTYDGIRMRVGKTEDDELERLIQTTDRRGEIYARLKQLRDTYGGLIRGRFPDIPRRVSGYNLDQLLPEHGFHVARALVGSESTCALVLEATVRLVSSPPARTLLVLGYPDIYTGCDQIPGMLTFQPIGLEGFDELLIHDLEKKGLHAEEVAQFPRGRGWLLVEFGGEDQREADGRAQRLIEWLQGRSVTPDIRYFRDPTQQKLAWSVRESALGATSFVPGEAPTWPGWEDSAVPPERLGAYLRELRHLLDSFHYRGSFYGHFGQGCLHSRINFDLETKRGIETFHAFLERATDLVLKYGGSLSGEHGDGQARAEFLPKMFGNELVEAFREFKAIWDPDWKLNPGKLVDPYRADENLRLGTAYNPMPVKTHFQFPDDEGSFAHATLRCVGVGKCRRLESGTMCPSFMVTREEEHTTRGRARLLFEMMQGDLLSQGWRSEKVREALDLCLACKGCKGDCPVNVDMATYKAEFLSHYYQGRLRPRTAYSMGLIYWWARLASHMPRIVNCVTHAPGLSSLVKLVGGFAQERHVPLFATQTFKRWFQHRGTRRTEGTRVVLWPDTFHNYLKPEAARAAVEVLEAAGCQVVVPRQSLCCGRPLYDYGFLDQAKRLMRQILDTLAPEIEAGVPVVVLEPSCAAVFRDELRNLFPHDENAKRLSQQMMLLSEFLEQQGYNVPKLQRKALVHGHCHHKAIMKLRDEEAILRKLGLDFQVLDSGCCGMAGAFGFEKDHYAISMKVGERVLLPAVRQAEDETLIIADGFSCREQIEQTTERRALHLAQVIQMALHGGQEVHEPAPERSRVLPLALLSGALALGGLLVWRQWRKR